MNWIGEKHIPDPYAFSHEGDPNQVVVYELGYPVKLLDRVLTEQLAFEADEDFPMLTYHFP